MKINIKNKKDLFFKITGIFLFLTTIVLVVYLISFLANNIEAVFGPRSIGIEEETVFNLNGLKELEIMK